jgi:hypothetical protein
MPYLTFEQVQIAENETAWEYFTRISNLALNASQDLSDNIKEHAQEWIHTGRIIDPEILVLFLDPEKVPNQDLVKKQLEAAFSKLVLTRSGIELMLALKQTPNLGINTVEFYQLYIKAKNELADASNKTLLVSIKNTLNEQYQTKSFFDSSKERRIVYAGQTLDRMLKVLAPNHEAEFLTIKTNIDTYKQKYDLSLKKVSDRLKNIHEIKTASEFILQEQDNLLTLLEPVENIFDQDTDRTTLFSSLALPSKDQLEKEFKFLLHKSMVIEKLMVVYDRTISKIGNPSLATRLYNNFWHAATESKSGRNVSGEMRQMSRRDSSDLLHHSNLIL